MTEKRYQLKETTGQNILAEMSELQCIIAARHLHVGGWECLVFEDKDELIYYMSDKYDFEFENGDKFYWHCIMDELPHELDELLSKHTYVSGWSFHDDDYEFSEDRDDVNEFELLKDQFLNGGENVEFGNIFTMKEVIENTDVRYNSILSKALMTMLDEGIDFEYRSEKYIEVQ